MGGRQIGVKIDQGQGGGGGGDVAANSAKRFMGADGSYGMMGNTSGAAGMDAMGGMSGEGCESVGVYAFCGMHLCRLELRAFGGVLQGSNKQQEIAAVQAV
jgi:hypothetical protein